MSDIVDNVREWLEEEPLAKPPYSDIRDLIDHIAALEARNARLEEHVGRALEELKLWRMLVNEGGVPRYTITPGAALNTVVTSTDGLIRTLTTEQTNG